MRRLTGALAGRLREDRGAIAVFVALSMVVLLAFAAIAINTSAVRRDQQVLRNAADAAALAVALRCAQAAPFVASDPVPTSCSLALPAAQETAERLVSDNSGAGRTVTASLDGLTVTVTVTAEASRPIPIGPGTVSVSATAEWTPATISYAASYPLALSYCRFLQLPAGEPFHLPAEPNGLWLLPARQEVTPTAWSANDSCSGPSGSLVLPSSAMLPVDPGAPCGSTAARGRYVTGQVVERVALAARTCVADSQYFDVTDVDLTYGGHEVILPVYDQVSGDQYRISGHLSFHVMGRTTDGGLWGFSNGDADPLQGDTVPSSVRLVT